MLPLSPLEAMHIKALHHQGVRLRNKVGIIGHAQPSLLDAHIAIQDQQHWATGGAVYQSVNFEPCAGNKRSKLNSAIGDSSSEVLDAVYRDIKFALTHLIPNAQELEGEFWTLSDYPSTSGGRFAALNVGALEFMVWPRQKFGLEEIQPQQLYTFINFPKATLIPEEEWEEFLEFYCEEEPDCFTVCLRYPLVDTDRQYIPVGKIEEWFKDNPDLISPARTLVLDLMRRSKSNLFKRWHSPDLVREAMNQ